MTRQICSAVRPASRWVIGVGVLVWLGGCSGGTVDTNVRLPAADRPDLTPTAASETLRIPSEVGFNYPRFSSGQEGADARGSAVKVGADGATCLAEVNGKGQAWGAFQLGYAFDNKASGVSHCVVRVRLTAEETVSAQRPAGETVGDPVDGSINLVFFMKDSMGLTVKEESLVSSSLNRGPKGATTQHDFVFEADMQPERGYYVVVSGRVDASSADGASSRVELKVSGVSMELRWHDEAAATVRAASSQG